MASWIRVAEVIPVKKAFIRKVSAGSRDICLVGLNGKIYAVSAKCPHAGADLSQGWCVDKQLVCPVHRFKYDLETGRGAAGQGDYVDTFPVEIRTDGVYVQINKRRWLF